jgi:hypothetical protein
MADMPDAQEIEALKNALVQAQSELRVVRTERDLLQEQLNRFKRLLFEGSRASKMSAYELGVSPSTISRELRRADQRRQRWYFARLGEHVWRTRRRSAGLKRRKLDPFASSPGWLHVLSGLHSGWSPEQIAGRLKRMPASSAILVMINVLQPSLAVSLFSISAPLFGMLAADSELAVSARLLLRRRSVPEQLLRAHTATAGQPVPLHPQGATAEAGGGGPRSWTRRGDAQAGRGSGRRLSQTRPRQPWMLHV